jgi:NO-binding membrane sensor protein with MHYT domain
MHHGTEPSWHSKNLMENSKNGGVVPSCPPHPPCCPVGPTLPGVTLSSSTLPSPSCCHGGLVVIVGPSSAHVVVLPHRCSLFPPHEQSLAVVVGGAAVMSIWSCYFVIVVVLIPHVPVSCSSFPVLLSLVVSLLSLLLHTYLPCEQRLAVVVVDGGVMGCCLVV